MIILLTIAGVLFGWIFTSMAAAFITKGEPSWFHMISGGYIGGVVMYACICK